MSLIVFRLSENWVEQDVPEKENKVLKKYRKGCIYYAISEIARNILLGNIPINHSEENKLRRYKGKLRTLNLRKTPLKERMQIIQVEKKINAFTKSVLIPHSEYVSLKKSSELDVILNSNSPMELKKMLSRIFMVIILYQKNQLLIQQSIHAL